MNDHVIRRRNHIKVPGTPGGATAGSQRSLFILVIRQCCVYNDPVNVWAIASYLMAQSFGAVVNCISWERGLIHGVRDDSNRY